MPPSKERDSLIQKIREIETTLQFERCLQPSEREAATSSLVPIKR